MNLLAFSINDLLGPLIALGPLSLAVLTWIGLVYARNQIRQRENEPAPEVKTSELPES